MVNTNQEFVFRTLDFVGKLKSGFVHEKSNRFKFSAETKLWVQNKDSQKSAKIKMQEIDF